MHSRCLYLPAVPEDDSSFAALCSLLVTAPTFTSTFPSAGPGISDRMSSLWDAVRRRAQFAEQGRCERESSRSQTSFEHVWSGACFKHNGSEVSAVWSRLAPIATKSDDVVAFQHGLLRWSVRMLQYREPTPEQKTRMLQLASACATRLLVTEDRVDQDY